MIELETHREALLILPCIAIVFGECECPECLETHVQISVGWGIWSLHVYFDL